MAARSSTGARLAYADKNEIFASPLRTLRRTVDFSGRSQRTEAVYYWIAAYAVVLLLGFTISLGSPFDSPYAADALDVLLSIPMVALLVRRLHDQDRPGWPAVILPISIALGLIDLAHWAQWDPRQAIAYRESGPHPLQWLQAAAGLATLVLFLLPGTEGANRYGGDPRLVDD
jgi:uncharacterized membrane protein YhaH (DUF805 family)